MNEKEIKTIEKLKDAIYELLREYFKPEKLNHDVARDFSEDDLDNCISYYCEYICK